MKFLKSIDFMGQTVILLAGSGITLGNMHWWRVELMLTQAAIGVWQFVSSLITKSSASRFSKLKRQHFTLTLITLAIFVLMLACGNTSWNLFFVFGVVVPWILAIGYYILTTLGIVNRRSHTGKFLPHTSF